MIVNLKYFIFLIHCIYHIKYVFCYIYVLLWEGILGEKLLDTAYIKVMQDSHQFFIYISYTHVGDI